MAISFEKLRTDGCEQVVYCSDSSVGLKAIIALHSLALGPATGGCRMWNYGSEEEALYDVLRLSKGMTYKASISGLNWGGGKAVILGDPKTQKSPELLKRFGQFVERLGGTYITAKDVGIGADDLREMKKETQHILGIEGDKGSSGDPSPSTALGVYLGIKACAQFTFQAKSLKGLKIALQGLGSVSFYLLNYLMEEGAEVVACDVDSRMIERATSKYNIEIVSPDRIYDVPCDIFSPCALGAVINSDTIPRLRTKVIAGAANNQLATPEDGFELMRRDIVYAPDYAINAGGLINIYYEDRMNGVYRKTEAQDHVCRVGKTVESILERAKSEQLPTHMIADRIAEERVQKASLQKN
jgi:leucine dehydrogenase